MSASGDTPGPLVVVVRATPATARDGPGSARVAAQRAAARAARGEAAAAAGVGGLEWRQAEDGKPLVTDGWRWSISHDAERVAAAVADGPLGVDLERVTERRRELVERVVRPAERAHLPEGALGFTRAWTAKEAVLKATTLGLGGLSRCTIVERRDAGVLALCVELDGERWHVEQRLEGEHVLAVTRGPRVVPVHWDVRD